MSATIRTTYREALRARACATRSRATSAPS